MNILTDWHSFPPNLRGGVLCVGNFDGVHIGHARMLATGKAEAQRRNAPFTIMTFDPHPATILRPGVIRHPLTTPSQREQLLARFQPDALLVLPPTREFLAITAEEFLATIVRDTLAASVMVEGPTFTFGRGAKGNVSLLQSAGPSLGITPIIVPTEQIPLSDLTLVNVSSSLIRWLVENGRVVDAAKCLGRPYTLRGEVVHGAKRGRAIGFPTANIATPQLLPGPGIYAGKALVDNTPHLAAISIGTNPTFHGTLTTVEAFLLDFDADLYGKTLDLQFHHWLRDMYPFAGIDPLVNQMDRDVQTTRQLLAH